MRLVYTSDTPRGTIVFELRDGAYVQLACVVGEEGFAAERPFPVAVVPARLLDGTRP